MLIKAELSFLLERVDHHTSFCTEFCLISGGNIPYESYITPAKDPYATRECELVDNSVCLTVDTLYPLLSNLAALQAYDQYHDVLPLSILGRGEKGAICCIYIDTCKQWIKRQLFCEDARAMGYITWFSMPWTDKAWDIASKQYKTADPTKTTNRSELCTLICAMNPMGRLLIIPTLAVDQNQRLGFDLPDVLSGLLMGPRIVKMLGQGSGYSTLHECWYAFGSRQSDRCQLVDIPCLPSILDQQLGEQETANR
jgi:hypothetical protein